MPKSGVPGAARRRQAGFVALPTAIEGQIAEICRELAVQAKRMRQLQEQADELRVVIREWSDASGVAPDASPAIRGGQR